MPRLKDGLLFKHLITSYFLLLTQRCAGQSQVVGPPQPIVATLGGEVTLPCHLEPSVDASDMTVEWARPDLDPRFVYVWRDGVELESKQHPSYKGRTLLPTENLKHGNISLTLSKVKISDEGKYRCFVPTLDRESTVELAVGVAPLIVISTERNSGKVVLQCESKGWYPEPEVFWLDAEGNLLSAGPTETVRGPDDLYTVSRRLTVEKSHDFTCRVQQKNINQTRETHFYVSDDLFSSSAHIIIIIIISLVLVLIVILAVIFAVWAWRRKNKMKKVPNQSSPEEMKEEECVRPLQHKEGLENHRDKLRSELEEMKRERTAKKYDLVSIYERSDEVTAKNELDKKIRELEKSLKETEEEIKTLERVTEREEPVKTQLETDAVKTQRSSQDQSSQRKESDENTEMLSDS